MNQQSEKFFNTAGPAQEDIHYTLDPLRRINYEEVSSLITQRKYFVLHAPRQTGKTTSLLAMVRQINDEGLRYCVYFNVEAAQTARNDVQRGMTAILSRLESAVEHLLKRRLPNEPAEFIAGRGADAALVAALESFCEKLDKPLVLFIDEIDALIGDTLVSVLRQLRDGYASRPGRAPVSVILCGVRDVRDYRIHMSSGDIITGGSCFNVKAKSLRLGNFSEDDIRELYGQHTAATGQVFEENIYPKIWDLTWGQPWLVNALAHQATWEMRENRDRTRPITLKVIEEAANHLILERATHLDQLADKLREPRVRRVLESLLAGENWKSDPPEDDIQYVLDLGLLRRDRTGVLVIANGIYREVLPRQLSGVMQDKLAGVFPRTPQIKEDGSLNMPGLLSAFQQFFRENSESWLERFDYKEAGFQLLLQAFLQRIVNGGGQIDREYALGRKRVDLLVRWRHPPGVERKSQEEQRIVLELKTLRENSQGFKRVLSEGLEQTFGYADLTNASEAHLIICDERSGRAWDEKIFDRVERYGGKEIHLWGM
ncbi:MAG: ATP-binding protein [Synergistaceae bacterium]|jgi:hypothetical protein|nr:ATP-binding protein [Synergistaceae bacterium]